MIPKIARLALPALVLPCLAVAQTGAAPAGTHTGNHHAHARHHRRLAIATPARPQPPSPASTQTAGTTPAPVPNEGLTAPQADRPAPEANITPSVFPLNYPPQGDGYVTGSSRQGMDDRNAARATGVQATVPLPQ